MKDINERDEEVVTFPLIKDYDRASYSETERLFRSTGTMKAV